jgi:hypothetical protein
MVADLCQFQQVNFCYCYRQKDDKMRSKKEDIAKVMTNKTNIHLLIFVLSSFVLFWGDTSGHIIMSSFCLELITSTKKMTHQVT